MPISSKPIQIADWYLVRPIGENVFWVNEPGHVSFYIFRFGNNGLFIDSGLGLSDEAAQLLLSHLNISTFAVYCTHLHCDHTGLNHLAEKVFVSKKEWAKYIEQNEIHQISHYHELLKNEKKWPLNATVERKIQNWFPYAYISDNETFYFGNWKFTALEVPVHTSGSFAFFEDITAILLLGDLIYSGTMYAHLRDSDFGDYKNSVNKILYFLEKNPDHVSIWPSHIGIPLNLEFIKSLQSTLENIDKNKISPTRTWPKDTIFEEGIVFEDGAIKFVLKKTDYEQTNLPKP